MKPRQQRMLAVGLAAVGVIIATALTLQAMKDSMMFFIEISDVVAGEYPQDRNFRIRERHHLGTVGTTVEKHRLVSLGHRDAELVHYAARHAGVLVFGRLAEENLVQRVELVPGQRLEERRSSHLQRGAARQPGA